MLYDVPLGSITCRLIVGILGFLTILLALGTLLSLHVEILGPVAATGKNTHPNWTATGKDWTSSCSCLNSKPVQLQLSHFEESGQPVIWWIYVCLPAVFKTSLRTCKTDQY
jgi:hypothetical protein